MKKTLPLIQYFSAPEQNLEAVYTQPKQDARKGKNAQRRKNPDRAQIDVPKLIADKIAEHKKRVDAKYVKGHLQ